MNQDTSGQLPDTDCLLAPQWLLLPGGPVKDYALRIEDGRFTAVGKRQQLTRQYPELPVRDLPGKLIMPGFIDTHHHLTQAFGKSLVFGEPSEIFRRVWVPLESSLNEHIVYLSSKLAALESLRGGFTTVADAGTRSAADLNALARAADEAGLRCVLGLICNDAAPGSQATFSDIVTRAEQHLAGWNDYALIHPSLAVSIPEIASDDMLHKAAALCTEAGAVFQTHANEHLVAVERSLDSRRLRPIEHLAQADALGPNTLLAHATLITPEEIKMVCDSGTAVSYNPVASAWKGNAVLPAHLMATFGARLGLGTDGTRSDAFRLMDYAEAAQRFTSGLASGDSSSGGGYLWLDMATRRGAEVLQLSSQTGSIEVGKAADFLIVDLDVPEMTPSWDLSWELVRLANRSQIEAVFVAGHLRLWQGWPVDWDAPALMREISELAGAAVKQAPIKKIHPFTWQRQHGGDVA